MHTDFRISCVDRLCAFDAESFIRMHQLMDRRVGGNTSASEHLVTLTRKSRSADPVFRPCIKVQFVFENLVRTETTEIFVNLERHQHEKQVESNWDGSEVSTKRYNGQFQEAVIASLPQYASERDLKIRILQLAPKLDKTDSDMVQLHYPAYLQKTDRSLCLGVAKVRLRELILTKGGVCASLQPKQNMMSVVEARNLNTIVTNAMFGKDVGGIAVLTIQVVSHMFSQKSISSMLWLSQTSSVDQKNNAFDCSLGLSTCSVRDRSSETVHFDELRKQMATPAVRFALIPYVVCIDRLLRLNEVISWTRPVKTFLLLCIVLILLLADFGAMGFVVAVLFECIASLRVFLFFYSGPPRLQQQQLGHAVMLQENLGRKDNFRAILYGSHNVLLNNMMRVRLFFGQGMQADCYLEFAYIVHRLRRSRRWILPCLAVVLLGLLFGPDSLVLWAILGTFVVYPLQLRISITQLRRKWSQQFSSGILWKSISLCQPMPVSRVVNVGHALGHTTRGRSGSFTLCDFQPVSALPPGELSIRDEHRTRDQSLPRMPLQATLPMHAGRPSRSAHGIHKEDSIFQPIDMLSMPWVMGQSIGDDAPFTSFNINNNSAGFSGIFQRSHTGDEGVFSSKQTPKPVFALVHITSTEQHNTPGGISRTASLTTASGMFSGGQVQVVQRMRRLLQRVRSLERSPPPRGNELREHYFAFFNSILAFLQFLRQRCTLEVYLSPPPSGCGAVLKLDQFARAPWLVEKGEDDGVTSTLIKHSFQQVSVGRLQPLHNFDNGARGFALLSSYILQGKRLSLYTGAGSRGCAILLPLRIGSLDMEMAPEPNPCPPSLRKVLSELWKGWPDGELPIEITTDVVLKVIETYKSAWSGGSSAATGGGQPGFHQRVLSQLEDTDDAHKSTMRLLHAFGTSPVGRPQGAAGPTAESLSHQTLVPWEAEQASAQLSSDRRRHFGSVSGRESAKSVCVHRAINSWGCAANLHKALRLGDVSHVSSSVADLDCISGASPLRRLNSDPPLLSQTVSRKETLKASPGM